MLRVVLVLLVVSWSAPALGIEPTRIERLGKACPVGYATEGGYCIPGADAEFAFHMTGGGCPAGYSVRRGYCVAGNSAELTILRTGSSCPSNYRSSQIYCIAKSNAKAAIPKNGHCPRGWRAIGRCCISKK